MDHLVRAFRQVTRQYLQPVRRECGALTCLAFAVEMAGERASTMRCSPLFTPPLAGKRNLLLKMLSDAGYEVPSVFLNAADHAA
jgi:ArsR family metal-binding transcriptional regulator